MCTQPSPAVSARVPPKEDLDNLGKCFSVHCGDYKTEIDCNVVFGCFWCYKKTDGSLLKNPSCKTDQKCYGGVLGRENPFVLPHKEKRKLTDRRMFTFLGLKVDKTTMIAAYTTVGVLVIISVVAICCLRRRKAKSGEEEAVDMFAVEEQPQLMGPTDDQGFVPLQMNYPGQSAVMQSNMQMGLGGPRMGYSMQAMSAMWSQAYRQSQIMSFIPQISTMQTPGAYPRKPRSKRPRPKKIQKTVSFSNDAQEGGKEEPTASDLEPLQAPEFSTENPEVIDNPEVIEGEATTEMDGEF